MAEQQDYYRILQVDPSAEPEVIEAAYRRLARKYHPDTNPSPDAPLIMKELNKAFDILGNPGARAQYDQARLMQWQAQSLRRQPNPSRTWQFSLVTLALVGGVLALILVFVIMLVLGVGVYLTLPARDIAATPTARLAIARPMTPTATPTVIVPTRTNTPRPTRVNTPRVATPVPTLAPQQGAGYARSYPAPFGQSVTWTGRNREQLNLTMLDLIRGDDAWRQISASNPFNPTPSPGWEYLLYKIRAEYVRASKDAALMVTSDSFVVVSSDGKEYKPFRVSTLVASEPFLLAQLFVGDSVEGWMIWTIPAGDTHPLLAYGQTTFSDEMRVWLDGR